MTVDTYRARWEAQPQNILARFSYAQKLAEAELWADAIPHLKACLAERPDWLIPHLLLGKAYLAQNDPTSAKNFLIKARDLSREQEHETPLEEANALLEECDQ